MMEYDAEGVKVNIDAEREHLWQSTLKHSAMTSFPSLDPI